MSLSTISNDSLRVEINSLGAELYSVVNLQNGRETLWQGVPEVWKSRSPVLFPIVGALCGGVMHQDGKEYSMAQHGFARVSEFEVVKHESAEIVYRLVSSEQTRKIYPYEFSLEIGYRLEGSNIEVSYRVENTSQQKMYFQLGAHPGFNYVDYDPEAEVQGYLRYDNSEGEILSGIINDKGLLIERTKSLALDVDSAMEVTKNLFDDGALIIENSQARVIEMLDRDKKPYVRVTFDAPVVGVWSIAKGAYAPYLCIEPWYGRCDKVGYTGEFADRDWMQSLDEGEVFKTGLSVWIGR